MIARTLSLFVGVLGTSLGPFALFAQVPMRNIRFVDGLTGRLSGPIGVLTNGDSTVFALFHVPAPPGQQQSDSVAFMMLSCTATSATDRSFEVSVNVPVQTKLIWPPSLAPFVYKLASGNRGWEWAEYRPSVSGGASYTHILRSPALLTAVGRSPTMQFYAVDSLGAEHMWNFTLPANTKSITDSIVSKCNRLFRRRSVP